MNRAQNLDPDEIAQFSKTAPQWWDESGPFAPLHRLNPVRLRYILDQLGAVAGAKILDVGCGGGLLCEPLTRKGAHITGIDASAETIEIAQTHARTGGLSIEYQVSTVENLPEQAFDALLVLEVVEHVKDLGSFIKSCAEKLKPNGKIILSTINRTQEAFLFAIIGAEYILRWLPVGTHHYHKFVQPQELENHLAAAAIDRSHQTGIVYNPIAQNFYRSPYMRINYMMTGIKRSSPPHE